MHFLMQHSWIYTPLGQIAKLDKCGANEHSAWGYQNIITRQSITRPVGLIITLVPASVLCARSLTDQEIISRPANCLFTCARSRACSVSLQTPPAGNKSLGQATSIVCPADGPHTRSMIKIEIELWLNQTGLWQ